ncbi:MAG TPA: class II aldolase/adducin family protein [Gaiellaceae bacterium]|nr:class II aldolase/adducin family protein [Gaiellaceae bacterium]
MVLRALALREEIVATLRRMEAAGLVRGTEGNVSARAGELVAVSPTSLPYETLRPQDVSLVTAGGELVDGCEPTVELPLHLAVLAARPDVGAVVHTHSPRATARPPAPVAEGASGTPELGAAVVAAAGEGHAVVMRGHGPVCFGADLAEALERALALEEAAGG